MMTEYWPDFPPPRREEKQQERKTCALTKHFNCLCPMCQLNDEMGRRAEKKKYDQQREAHEAAERNRPGPGFIE